jgi:hypothetical protein
LGAGTFPNRDHKPDGVLTPERALAAIPGEISGGTTSGPEASSLGLDVPQCPTQINSLLEIKVREWVFAHLCVLANKKPQAFTRCGPPG